ncbi:MAG: hypothetical protein OXU23_14305 [Candidatus Poribacteria bacterium]|nr:hypothetical protein [Candidatus Poribacteria bacterium]
MSIKQVLFTLGFLILMGMVGIAIDQVNLLSILAFCLIVGIPLYVITNRSKFIHLWQSKRRQDLINRYGFYETVETQKGKLIGDDMLGDISMEKWTDDNWADLGHLVSRQLDGDPTTLTFQSPKLSEATLVDIVAEILVRKHNNTIDVSNFIEILKLACFEDQKK